MNIKQSIRNKLILLLLLATVVPIVITMAITYDYTKNSVKDNSIRDNANLIYQGKTNIMNYLNAINQASLEIYQDPDLMRALEAGVLTYENEPKVYRTLNNMSLSVKEIHQIHLYVAESEQSYLFSGGNIDRGFQITQPFLKGMQGATTTVLEPSHRSHNYGVFQLRYNLPTTVLSMHRSIVRVPSTQVLGSVSIDFRLDALQALCSQLYSVGEEQLYILDRTGTVIYASDNYLIGQPFTANWSTAVLNPSQTKGSFEKNQAIYIHEKINTPYAEWTLVKEIPYAALYKDARQLTRINLLVTAFMLVIIVAATVYISVRITKPIKQLIGYINTIQTGKLDIDIHIRGQDEIGLLARRFRKMMETINGLILREYRLDILNKSNQLKVLQAQVNPHFINNALQSIGTLALQHQAPKIYSLLSSLSKMMRYSMATHDTIVPFHKEVEHVKAYLELQKQRFEDRLIVKYQFEESTLPIHVPKMILQPLVENYFKHGFESLQEEGRIVLSSSLENGFLVISAEDNGPGIPEQSRLTMQSHLNEGIERIEDSESGIGLGNIISRLKLHYPEPPFIELENVEPHGLRVTIWIPIEKGNEMT